MSLREKKKKKSNLKLKGAVFTLEVQPEHFSTFIQDSLNANSNEKKNISFLKARSIKLLLLPLPLHIVVIASRRGS